MVSYYKQLINNEIIIYGYNKIFSDLNIKKKKLGQLFKKLYEIKNIEVKYNMNIFDILYNELEYQNYKCSKKEGYYFWKIISLGKMQYE